MSKRSHRRRALTGGEAAWSPGYGPGEPHEGEEFPFDDFGGGVREPRRPKPAPPSLTMAAEPPPAPFAARDMALSR
ncbi:hypothetical protein OIE66_13825 [Nonomuraea sp. NBC_01738]|uniref:hypothetical protein n=1 Tax=Nonomuraea sp. NBC_01738 TaxID=2976003 RepID=UPI002E14DF4D|nr:hypothetical protein OIE66_13825 [Nonomuraea sp. NBC_01738]